MSKGFLKKDYLLVEKEQRTVGNDFVEVNIRSQDGYEWGAEGSAGMVIVSRGNDSEVDIVAKGEEVSQLLATALIKVHQMMGPEVVKKAIELYGK